jgi:hypothetical protein
MPFNRAFYALFAVQNATFLPAANSFDRPKPCSDATIRAAMATILA